MKMVHVGIRLDREENGARMLAMLNFASHTGNWAQSKVVNENIITNHWSMELWRFLPRRNRVGNGKGEKCVGKRWERRWQWQQPSASYSSQLQRSMNKIPALPWQAWCQSLDPIFKLHAKPEFLHLSFRAPSRKLQATQVLNLAKVSHLYRRILKIVRNFKGARNMDSSCWKHLFWTVSSSFWATPN